MAAPAPRSAGPPSGAAEAGAIDAALRTLHGGDAAAELSRLHEAAATLMATAAERRFHLTHAWVFALEAGDRPRIRALEASLRAAGGL